MEQLNPMKKETVNCRIGSLEKYRKDIRALGKVNCRIGSLETSAGVKERSFLVN